MVAFTLDGRVATSVRLGSAARDESTPESCTVHVKNQCQFDFRVCARSFHTDEELFSPRRKVWVAVVDLGV
jgi:hypothetical protein